MPISATATYAAPPRIRGSRVGIAILLLVLSSGYLPLLMRFAGEQWGRAQYQFFPLMLAASAVIALQRLREREPGAEPGLRSHAPFLLASSLLVFAVACLLWSGRLAASSALLSLIALAWHLGGRSMLRALTPSFILLALVIGPPVGIEDMLLQRMRELAVSISGGVLVLLGIPHLATGTIIEIPGSRLLVAEACSGINSLMAVLGCTMVIGFVRRRSPRVIVLLLVCGVLFVLWANVVRIAGGVWLKTEHQTDILGGEAHEVTSLVLFAVCILMVLCTDEALGLLRWLLKEDVMPAAAETDDPVVVPEVVTVPSRRIGAVMWLLAAAFALTGGGAVAYAHTHGGLARWLDEPGTVHLRRDVAFAVPAQLGRWARSEEAEKRISQPEIEGKQSQVWAFRSGNMVALIAIDFPFMGYHDLTLCYRNGGWTIANQAYRTDAGATLSGHYTEIDLIRLNEHAMVWYSALTERGQWATPPATSATERIIQRLQHVGQPDWNSATYQVQLFVQGYESFTTQQREALQELFLLARRELGAQIIANLEQGAR